jgi:AraC family transcriptional regulator
MQQSRRAANRLQSLLRTGESTRLLGEVATPAGTIEEMVYAPGLCEGCHYHDKANFIYVVEGAHWAGHSRGGDTCHPGTVRFLPAGEPHETYFPFGSWCLQIELSESIVNLASEHGPMTCSPGELPGTRAGALGARLHEGFLIPDEASQLDVEAATLQLLLGESGASQRKAAPPWVLRVRDMLREEVQDRVTLAALSRGVGRHPVQISRQFHRHFNCTIGEYLRRARVARAQVLLRRHDLEITDIALACGFTDQSHFTTAFRKVTGLPPHRYRLQRITNASPVKPLPAAPPTKYLESGS